MSRYPSVIESIYDSIEVRAKRAQIRLQNAKKAEIETQHFKNVVVSRLGSNPKCAEVISKWGKTKPPVYCKIQLLNCNDWTKQEETDIEELYISFKALNEYIWDVEKRYGRNPEVKALISNIRNSSDVRLLPFQIGLKRILEKGGNKE